MEKFLLAAFAMISTPLYAQQGDINALTPQIAVGARGEVKVIPDRATIQISVHTRAVTAAAAATENATKVQSVLSALRARESRAACYRRVLPGRWRLRGLSRDARCIER